MTLPVNKNLACKALAIPVEVYWLSLDGVIEQIKLCLILIFFIGNKIIIMLYIARDSSTR